MTGAPVFFVDGRPRPQGSKDALAPGVVRERSPHLKAWRRRVAATARAAGWNARPSDTPPDKPAAVGIVFVMRRPKSHYTPKGKLRDSAPAFPDTPPDIDKLTRAILDALTGVCWPDDGRVIVARLVKVYGPREGVGVLVSHAAPVKAGSADLRVRPGHEIEDLLPTLDWWPAPTPRASG